MSIYFIFTSIQAPSKAADQTPPVSVEVSIFPFPTVLLIVIHVHLVLVSGILRKD